LSLSQARGKQPAKRQAYRYNLFIFMHYHIPEVGVLVGAANNSTGPSGLKCARVNQENLQCRLLARSSDTSDRKWPKAAGQKPGILPF
jgi:hypothetical protein